MTSDAALVTHRSHGVRNRAFKSCLPALRQAQDERQHGTFLLLWVIFARPGEMTHKRIKTGGLRKQKEEKYRCESPHTVAA
jgi:hypothetical protein